MTDTTTHTTDAKRLREEIARSIEPYAMMTIEERRAAYATAPPVVFGNRTQKQTESVIAYEHARAEYPRQQALSAADRILALPAIARAVVAPVEGEAKQYAPYLRMLSSRFSSFADLHDAKYGPGNTSSSIENRERSVLLARLADLLDGGDPDEIAQRKTVPSAEAVIADLSARLAEARDEAVIAGIARDNALVRLSDVTRKRDEAVEAEREACARLCEEASIGFDIEVWLHSTKKEMTAVMAQALAAAIRNRTTAPATTTEGGEA